MLIKNATIYTENGIIEKGYVKIHNDLIFDFGTMTDLTYKPGLNLDSDVVDVSDAIVAPGLIDQHMHGIVGDDALDIAKNPQVLRTFGRMMIKEGVTSYLPTLVTTSFEKIGRVCEAFCEYEADFGESEALGLSLEGPFINPAKAGAQDKKYISRFNYNKEPSVLERLQTKFNGAVKLMTYAPELDTEHRLLKNMQKAGIVASCGHSMADSDTMKAAINEGLSCVTHLFNCTTPMEARSPGFGVAALVENCFVELIADGLHVAPDMLKLAYLTKGSDQIVLITDSLSCKGMEDGNYMLGDLMVINKNGECRLEDGNLAGSTLRLFDAMFNMCKFTGCSLYEANKMASSNAARNLGIFDKVGSISKGKKADLIIFDENQELHLVIKAGRIVR